MPQSYSEETQEILADLLQMLSTCKDIAPDFLAELRKMTDEGELGDRTRIRRSIAIIKAKADELQDRQHRGS